MLLLIFFELLGLISVSGSEIVEEVKSSSSTESPPFLELEEEVQGFWFSLLVEIFGLRVGSNTSEGFGLAQPQATFAVKMVLRMFFLLEDM